MHLDHHCCYLAGCVGSGNLRNFCVFMAWVVLTAGYGVGLLVVFVFRQWGAISAHSMATWNVSVVGQGEGEVAMWVEHTWQG